MPSGYGDHRRQKIQDETYYQYPNGKSCYPFHIVLQNDCEFTGLDADGTRDLKLGRRPTLGERLALLPRKILLVTPDLNLT